LLAAAGCSLLIDAGSLSGAGPTDGSVPNDGGPPPSEGSTPPDRDSGDSGSAGCAGDAGPVMIRVGNDAGVSFCIDSTEVTVRQYQAFVDAKNGDMRGQIAECAPNTTYALHDPNDASVNLARGDAVHYVNWCDAFAYCRWANKRLCGSIGGGPASADPADLNGQWMFACSRGGALAYPYGQAFDASACNSGGGTISAPESKATCQGGFPGLFDMSGNVEEWEDNCDPASRNCHVRGGSAFDTDDNNHPFACGTSLDDDRLNNDFDVGFRCCSDP